MDLEQHISLLPKELIYKILLYYGCIDKLDTSLKKSIKVHSALRLGKYYMMNSYYGLEHNISLPELKRMYFILRNCGCCDRHVNYFHRSVKHKYWSITSTPEDKTRFCKWHHYNSNKINKRVYNDNDDCVKETYCNCYCRHIARFLVRHKHITIEEERGNCDINFNTI